MTHDHSHDHQEDVLTHVFSEATPYEQSLITRQQLMHVATEIYKAGVIATGAHVGVEKSAQRALRLIQEVDKIVASCRTDSYTPEE